jgi:hypothetical protein
MAESRTPKKSRKKRSRKPRDISPAANLDIATDLAAAYIKHWTVDRTREMLKNDPVPIIVPTKQGFAIGSRSAKRNKNTTWTVFNRWQEPLATFSWKSSAITYCVMEHLKKYTLSREIQLLDARMTKFEVDMEHYQKSLRNSIAKKDTAKTDFVWARYLYAKAQYEVARNNLEKSLTSNKYLKVWDTKS